MAENRTISRSPKSHYNLAQLLFLGLVFHVVFLRSVFDCYFTSPVVQGMRNYGATKEGEEKAPAKRLVLIVGDGLRADLLFNLNAFSGIENSSEIIAPYLRSIAAERGAFGISHTRVPTESRPGHVAIIGGMYEDVSAVTKGWKTNPVDFDSVFNRSSTTFSFGSPDILPMFAHGATPGKVKIWCYDEEYEDFTKDATALDVWSLDHLKILLRNATTDQQLMEELRADKVIFFLHLLGLDTTGHAYRPHSKEYMENIRVVDGIVKEAEELVERFYGDRSTAYVFTADHGMSEIGNHGDGHPDNTQTPLLAWGKGVRGPLPDPSSTSHDVYSQSWGWGLRRLYRRDVEQADVAPLMATLIGIDWPANSVGILPDVDPTRPGYLDVDDRSKAKAALVNGKVVLEQYRVKHDLKRQHTLWYKPFPPLADISADIDDFAHIARIESLLERKQWRSALEEALKLIQKSLEGLRYLQTYDRFLIKALVTAAYTGWIAFASLYIFRPKDYVPGSYFASSSTLINPVNAFGVAAIIGFWALFILQKSPLMFYVYTAFPCYFWHRFLSQTVPAIRFHSEQKKARQYSWLSLFIVAGMVVLALFGMVLAYTHRSIWSIGLVLIGLVWPFTWSRRSFPGRRSLFIRWACSCLITGIFPLLSVNKTESLFVIMVAGTIMLAAALVASMVASKLYSKNVSRLFLCQALLILLTMFITAFSIKNLQAKQGLPLINRVAGWAVLVIATTLPFVYRCSDHSKSTMILMYFFGICPLFIILSISVEGLFFIAYTLKLLTWVKAETIVRAKKSLDKKEITKDVDRDAPPLDITYTFQMDDLRIALFFLLFVQVGFFGTGNIASISSFYLAPVYRLIPVFMPFYMSALLIVKIIAPYVILSVIFAHLNDSLHLPPFSLLLVALTLTDGMTLTFFYMVQDTGSWLEIGQSITFFCIASLLLVWSAGICVGGEYLMATVIPSKRLSSSL